MLNKIETDPELSKIIVCECCENGVCVTIDKKIDRNDYIILKPDNYYNTKNFAVPPPSADCIIIRKCKDNGWGLTIAELKNIQTSSNFELENLTEKFKTCLNDFIQNRFKILNIEYKDIKLYFVSNIEIYKRDIGPKVDMLINTRFKYREKQYMITPYMPNPMIKNCY
ncbi:MAG: hypothetical protein F9K23_09350 [Bacteroidetes bacterium]|nr:MAG: hypothetical protein F9K23_09350 [Bacteroidota bacterium]